MKITYRVEAWCHAKDQATMAAIFDKMLSDLRAQKQSGNITEGDVIKILTEEPETTRIREGV